jgi:magnesium transporter
MGVGERREGGGGGIVRRPPWVPRVRSHPLPAPRTLHGMPVIIEHAGVRWIDIESPTPVSVAYLRDNFDFHEPDLEDVLDTLQRPKCDEYDDYLSIVLQFPVHSKATRQTTSTEVDIFVGRDYVITLHDTKLKPLVRLFDTVERELDQRDEVFGGGAEYLLHSIVDQLLDYCVPITRRISQRIEQIDEMVFDRHSLRTIEEIAAVRRDIIATRRIIKPQVPVINILDRRVRTFFKQRGEEEEELEAYFGDLVDKVSKIYDILDDAKEVVDSLSATTDSLSSHRLNEVIKILTIFSVIMLPLTLISSIYGMNVPLPLEQHPLSFVYLMVSMILIAILMVFFFRWRRWL